MRRLSCGTSELTFVDLLCNMKLVNRTNQLLNIGGKLIKNITDAKVKPAEVDKSHQNSHHNFCR